MALKLAAVVCGLALWSAPASAQTFVCPGGPGPGERQVGVTGGSNGVAAVPVCVRDGASGPAPQSVPVRAIDNYYAAAWHAESNDAWIVAGYRNKTQAERAALAACNRVMGGGCTLATSNVNGTVVIARGVEGGLYSADRAKKGEAEKAVKDYCRKQGDECELVTWVSAAPGSAPVNVAVPENTELFAPRSDPRRKFGAIAWVDARQLGGRPWIGDVWVVGGRPSAAKAKADVLALCQRDMPTPCTAALVASDVFVAVAERDGKSVAAASGATVELADKRAMAECKREKGKCRVTATIGLAQDIAYRFDPMAQGKPYFTAQAWTKGDAQPWTRMVWSVSGAKSEDAAKRAALAACAKDSKQECEIGSHSFNGLVIVYTDEKANTRLSSIEREVDPASYIADKCGKAKVTCRIVKVIDSRPALSERIDLR